MTMRNVIISGKLVFHGMRCSRLRVPIVKETVQNIHRIVTLPALLPDTDLLPCSCLINAADRIQASRITDKRQTL